jgi:hypothetical protein
MKKFLLALSLVCLVFVCTAALVGCGSGSNHSSGNINGNWTATLTDSNSNPVFVFTTSLTANNGSSTLNVTNFTFTTNDASCSISGGTETGSFTVSGDFNGNVTGQFQLQVTAGSPANADLTLTGTVNGNTISGTWSLTGGTGCSGSGNFTMTRV